MRGSRAETEERNQQQSIQINDDVALVPMFGCIYAHICCTVSSRRTAGARHGIGGHGSCCLLYTAESVVSCLGKKGVETKEMEVVVTSKRLKLGCLAVE